MRRFNAFFFATWLLSAPVALCAEADLTLGFSIGGTLEQAV